MCGIVGAYGWTDERTLSSMLDWIEHRGPDEEGSYVDEDAGVMLGARRLSIVDLDGGSQPVFNEDGTVCVAFNGEIYNHDDLRDTLSRRGHRFESECDTEVLVHLWEDHGPDLVDHLEGMFAFAIWDRDAETVCLARDRLGIKPLYYGRTDRGYVWGSELPTTLLGGVDRAIDPAALYAHFALEYTPGARTLLRDVRKVEPGTVVVLDDGGVEERSYWNLFDVETGSATMSLDSAAEEVRTLLERAVDRRLMADVPVGAFLSGGLDSSAIVGLAAERTEAPLDTYAVAFEDEVMDESAEARLVADHFGTNHHEVHVDLSSMDLFGDLVRHLGEPTGHLQMLPLFALARRASEDVTVVLAGEGADELFAGYPRYRRISAHKRRVDFLPDAVHDAAAAVAPVAPVGSKHLRYLAGLKSTADALEHHACGFTLFRPAPESLLDTAETSQSSGLRSVVESVPDRVDDPAFEQHVSAFESRYTLPDYHLFKADHTSMAHSLELRVPFLSRDLVEFARSLPVEYKVTPENEKRVLKRAVADLLPDATLQRKKLGMHPPVHRWFREDHESIETWFDREKLDRTPSLDADAVEALRTDHRRGDASVGRTLWTIMTYVAWYHTFLDESTSVLDSPARSVV